MRKMIAGIVWGMALYLLGGLVVGVFTGSQAADALRPAIALVAAAVAAAGSWKGLLPGARVPK